MNKTSFLCLLLLCGIALLGAHSAFSGAGAQTVAIRFLALSGYFLLCVSLIIGPLALFFPSLAQLIEPRRAVGLAAFAFVALHVLLASGLYFNWNVAKIVAMAPLAVAVPAAIILLILALTSSNWAIAKMGMNAWKLVQRFVYLAFALVTVHFVLKANGLAASNLNLAEAALLLLAAATVILQAAGFARRMRAKK